MKTEILTDASDVSLTPALDVPYDINSILTIPVSKLDADQYMAEDLDGVTESMFGSGNLNFLMLQAGQTNDSILSADPFSLMEADDALTSGNYYAGSAFTSAPFSQGAQGEGNDSFPDLQKYGHENDGALINPHTADNGFSAVSAGSFQTAPLSSTTHATDFSDLNSDLSSETIQTGQNGQNGTNGSNGSNGTGINLIDEINNVVNQVTNLLQDITNLGDTIGDQITTEVTDIVNNLPDLVTQVNNLLETTHITDILNQTPLGDTVTNITEGAVTLVTDLTEITNGLTDTVSGLIDDILNEGDIITTVTNILENPQTLLTTVTDLADTINLTHVTNMLTDATGIITNLPPVTAITNLIEDTGLVTQVSTAVTDVSSVVNNLLGNGANTDEEISLASDINLGFVDTSMLDPVLDLVEEPLKLDAVEDIVGDLDLQTGLGLDLLSQGGNETDNAWGDSDVTLGLDLGIVDNHLLGGDSGLSLDIVENITGDIDLDLGFGGNILGNLANPIVNDGAGGSGEDSQGAQLGNMLGEGAGSLLDTLNDDGNAGSDLFVNADSDLADTSLIDNNLLHLNTDLVLDPVESLLGQDVDVHSSDLLADIPVGDVVGEDLQIPGVDPGDIDLNNFDLRNVDLGDITLGGIDPDDFGIGDLGADTIISDEDTLELDLPELSDDTGSLFDSLNLDMDILADAIETVEENLDLSDALGLLDSAPVSSGLGDILGSESTGSSDATDVMAWTETIIPDAGSLLAAAAGDSGLGNILPAPTGSVTEGLGALLGNDNHAPGGHHGLGGLFG